MRNSPHDNGEGIYGEEYRWHLMDLMMKCDDPEETRTALLATIAGSEAAARVDPPYYEPDEVSAKLEGASNAALSLIVLEGIYRSERQESIVLSKMNNGDLSSVRQVLSTTPIFRDMLDYETSDRLHFSRERKSVLDGATTGDGSAAEVFAGFEDLAFQHGASTAFRSLNHREQRTVILGAAGIEPDGRPFQALGYISPIEVVSKHDEIIKRVAVQSRNPLHKTYGRPKVEEGIGLEQAAEVLLAEPDIEVWKRRIDPALARAFRESTDGSSNGELADDNFQQAIIALDTLRRGVFVEQAPASDGMSQSHKKVLLNENGREAILQLPIQQRVALIGPAYGLTIGDLAWLSSEGAPGLWGTMRLYDDSIHNVLRIMRQGGE